MSREPLFLERTSARLPLLALLIAVSGSLAGFGPCSDHVTGPGVGVGGGNGESTMSRSWPNEDGRTWDYAMTNRRMTGGQLHVFATVGEVPAVTLLDVDAALATEPDTLTGTGGDYAFRMKFEGNMTTNSGVVTQRLTESYPPAIEPLRSGSADFLARLSEARPDLRARLARFVAAPALLGALPRPNFIHGYGYLKGPLWIGSYGDVDTLLAWKYLELNMSIGHTFVQHLVPSLADDVLLRAKVARMINYDVPGVGLVRNCFEVRYLIDYGIMTIVDSTGASVGFSRLFDTGRVIYAPGVGPVLEEERRMASAGQPRDPGFDFLLLRATAVTPGPAALAAR